MKRIIFIISLTYISFTFSCKNTNSSDSAQPTNPTNVEENVDNSTKKIEKEEEIKVYSWVDKLNLRKQPDLKSEIVAEVSEGTAMIYLNEKTKFKVKINLRGTLYNEPWLKVKTEDGTDAWVYGGAVKFKKAVVDTNPYKNCYKDNTDFSAFSKCMEKVMQRQLTKDAKYVTQETHGIDFQLLNGDTKSFNTVPDAIQYDYRYYIPQMGFFVIEKLTQEDKFFILINDKSGNETVLKGFPKPSPDFKNMVTMNADVLGTGAEFNGIQLFGFLNGRFEKLFEKDWQDWFPEMPQWLDNNTVEFVLTPTQGLNRKPKTFQIKYEEATQEWLLQN